jgi:hypothetical protein
MLQDAQLSGIQLLRAQIWSANLRGADLRQANLQRARLLHANLQHTNLQRADLRGAEFQSANLQHANLHGVDLSGATFQYGNLQAARFEQAELSTVDFTGADLRGCRFEFSRLLSVNFYRAYLSGVWFNTTIFGEVFFLNVDLRDVHGLDTVTFSGPSIVSIDTLYLSQGHIPELFLRGCGVPDSMIEYARSLVAAERPIDYYSCFISYSNHDEALAERLYADLQARGVRCWYAPHHMQIGEPILSGIDRGIRLHDKLLLILSESSIESGWVEQEVHMALAREKTERRRVLFPIRIDDAVLDSHEGWPAILCDTIHIGDFRQWKEHDTYQAAFARLLRDLKTEQR